MSDVRPHNAKNSPAIPVRFTRLYMLMLVVLTVLLTLGQGLTQWRLRAVQDELWIIRYEALQRHQSQQIVKQALKLADPGEAMNFAANVAELRQVFARFARYHRQTRAGQVADHAINIPNSDTIQRLYDGIRPEFDAYERAMRQLTALRRPTDIDQRGPQASLQLLLDNEKPFLEEIDGIVRGHTNELRHKLTRLQTIELCLYGFTLLLLTGIGLLIFRPAARRLRQMIGQLVEAESRTAAVNKKLLSANQSLKETRQELYEATKQQYQRQIDEQKTRTAYLLAGQEEERKRLSRELHDGLGQMLTAIKLQLEGLEAGLKRELVADSDAVHLSRLRTLKNLVTQTIGETRSISNDLMPSVLSDFGIVPAIRLLAENDRSDAVDVTVETNLPTDALRFDRNVEIMLYRVAQEAVSNAVRHGKPSHIHIELIEREPYLHLLVCDDGRGFQPYSNGYPASPPPARPGRGTSQGLHNMRERAQLLNGKLRIRSEPGKGTTVQVSIPYQTQPAYHESH